MKNREIFTNPEVKKLTIKYLIVLIAGILTIVSAAYYINSFIKKNMIKQNIVIYASIIDGERDLDTIKTFIKRPDETKVEEAKKILRRYGYNEEMTLESNDMLKEILYKTIIVFGTIGVVFITTVYLLFMKQLKVMYKEIEEIIDNTDAMSQGKYKEIEGEEKEGDMAKLISSLNYMGDRVNNSIDLLKKDKENLKDFLSDISHQLKTPLASLVMFNDLMIENENMPYEDRVKFLKSSEEQLRRMEWLIMNILKMGRLEADVIKFNIYEQPLKETLEISVSSLLENIKNKNQNLTFTGDLEAEVRHDREWLAEAISNIVKNAVEHTEEGGDINIDVHKGPLITKIYIKDNGPGISEELQKKVFERFYKGENSTNPTSIGIGLSLAKSIIEEQNGEIKLKSEKGRGTTFIISFFE